MKWLCIYHANCTDGFGAAWVVKEYCKRNGIEVEFYPGVYNNEPPDVCGRDVLLVDFSYKSDVILEMARKANSITIIDHHKSAIEGLGVLAREGVINAYFDMNHSGAMLAWEYFFPGEEPPFLLEVIEDRDLWRFKMSVTRPIQAALYSHPYDFEVWDKLMYETDRGDLLVEGRAIERRMMNDMHELLGVTKRRLSIAGFNVPAANLPYVYSSDAGSHMAKGEPFAACYWDTPEGRVFSLRSTDEGQDVAKIAEQYGGGGHRNAAGFRVPLWRIAEFEE